MWFRAQGILKSDVDTREAKGAIVTIKFLFQKNKKIIDLYGWINMEKCQLSFITLKQQLLNVNLVIKHERSVIIVDT